MVQLLVNLGAVLLTHGLNSLSSRLIGRIDDLPGIPANVPRARPGARGTGEVSARLVDAVDGARFLEKAETVVDFSTSMSGDAQALLERLVKNTLQDQGPVHATPLKGIRVVDGRWYARVPARLRGQGWAEVSPAGGENVFLLDSQGKPIPWLQLTHNDGGLWDVAPEFRVRGGGPKKAAQKVSLADRLKEKEAQKVEAAGALISRLEELASRVRPLATKIEAANGLVEVALENRKPVSRAVDELVEKISSAADEQRSKLVSLLQKVQQPRLYAADLAVEKASLACVQLEQERIGIWREIVDGYKQTPDSYRKEIISNLEVIVFEQSTIYKEFHELLVEHSIPGLTGRDLFPSATLESGTSESFPLDAFVKEQRRLLDGEARLIEAASALESTLDELEEFSASSSRARRRELVGVSYLASKVSRFKELEYLRRALCARPATTDLVFHSVAKGLLRDMKISQAVYSHWEVLEHDGYGALERIEVLDSALKQYDLAASLARQLESSENPPVPQDLLKRFLGRLAELRASAQDALSAQILAEDLPQAKALSEALPMPHRKPVIKPAKNPSKRVFKNRNQETLIGDVSLQQPGRPQEISVSDPLGGKPINYYQSEGQEDWQVRLEQPVSPVKPNPGLLNNLMAKGKRQLDEVDAFIEWVKKPSNSAPEPVSLQEMLENRAKELEKTASEINHGLVALPEQERKPATIEMQARLGQQSTRLIEEARLLRIKTSRELPPSAGHFQYLLEQKEISLAEPVWTDKSTARETDFLLEYAILDEKKINAAGENEVLWYAHFHCPAKSTRFIHKGHLKLKALRYKTYQDQLNEARNGEQVRAIKAGDISQKFADRYFFKTAD